MSAGNDRHGVGHAAEGDTVWVLVNHIKPGKLDAHPRWIYDILMPVVERVAPEIHRTVRFLERHEDDEQPSRARAQMLEQGLLAPGTGT